MPLQDGPLKCPSCGHTFAVVEHGQVIHRSGKGSHKVGCINPEAIVCRCTVVTFTADLAASGRSNVSGGS
jgi:hypothetical protein